MKKFCVINIYRLTLLILAAILVGVPPIKPTCPVGDCRVGELDALSLFVSGSGDELRAVSPSGNIGDDEFAVPPGGNISDE